MLKLTEDHVARAFKIAHWYGRRARRAEVSDLESAALEGLAQAACAFDPDAPRRDGRYDGGKRSFWTFAFRQALLLDLRLQTHPRRDEGRAAQIRSPHS